MPKQKFAPRNHELLTATGENALAADIQAFWHAQGKDVVVTVEYWGRSKNPPARSCQFSLRSDMINGLPRPANSNTLWADEAA
jgi:hypothetical protein